MAEPIRPSSRAEFKQWVDAAVAGDRGFIDEVLWETFKFHVEQAVVRLADGRLAVVTGEVGRITFEVGEDGRPYVEAEGGRLGVVALVWHTHPMATGPSDGDFSMLEQLGQSMSRIYEVGGEVDGTDFYRKRGVR